jgi:hypothetical protein
VLERQDASALARSDRISLAACAVSGSASFRVAAATLRCCHRELVAAGDGHE